MPLFMHFEIHTLSSESLHPCISFSEIQGCKDWQRMVNIAVTGWAHSSLYYSFPRFIKRLNRNNYSVIKENFLIHNYRFPWTAVMCRSKENTFFSIYALTNMYCNNSVMMPLWVKFAATVFRFQSYKNCCHYSQYKEWNQQSNWDTLLVQLLQRPQLHPLPGLCITACWYVTRAC